MSNAKYLLSNMDLSEFDLGTINQLFVKEVIEMGEQKFSEFLSPFLIDYKPENGIKLFDILFLDNEQMNSILMQLISSLKKLYKTDKIDFNVDESKKIYMKISDAVITRDNFDKLCEVISEMFFIAKPEDETEHKVLQVAEQNKAILEEYLRLEEQHKKEMEEINKKNVKTIHQIVTIVASQCLWDYDKVLDMTYYRLINTYVSIFKIDNYNTYMQYKTSGQFDMKNQNQKHWTEIVGK